VGISVIPHCNFFLFAFPIIKLYLGAERKTGKRGRAAEAGDQAREPVRQYCLEELLFTGSVCSFVPASNSAALL